MEVEEMIAALARMPIIRNSTMGQYQDCIIRYKNLIAVALGNKS